MNTTETRNAPDEDFRVAPGLHLLGGLVSHHRPLWTRLGELETRLLAQALTEVRVRQPVYVTGLARSGSTLLLELLHRHPGTVTHRYQDYPMLFTPYWWNRFLDFTPRRRSRPVERTHRDGILITPESPEAFEEMLWMAFFPRLHHPASSAVLDGDTDNPRFETFYRDHIRKLLLARGGQRYVCKENYNVTRLEYLLKQFPDARFLVPVREPVWHVASLMKQHRLFCAGLRDNRRARLHLLRAGHFEFGPDRRPINAGDRSAVLRIQALWDRGAEVEGWARYWSHIHGHVADALERNPALRAATLVVRYEHLCRAPVATVRAIFRHCGLSPSTELLEHAARRVRFPDYYRPGFNRAELEIIERCTETTAARYGMGRLAEDVIPIRWSG
jgi:hypothetical protein